MLLPIRLSGKPFGYATRIVPALGERSLLQWDVSGVSGVGNATGGRPESGRERYLLYGG
jgi:hypothetical protein